MPEDHEDPYLQDTLGLLALGAQERVEFEDDDGRMRTRLEADPEISFWQSQMVNSPHLGEAVVKFKRLEQKALECRHFMTIKRAIITEKLLLAWYKHYRYGIVSKSSETVRDKDNNQDSLIHVLRKQTVQREFNTKDTKSAKMLSGWLGRNDPDDS
jgi:hypothetical protein